MYSMILGSHALLLGGEVHAGKVLEVSDVLGALGVWRVDFVASWGEREFVWRYIDRLCVMFCVFCAVPECAPIHRGTVCRACQEPESIWCWIIDAIRVLQR